MRKLPIAAQIYAVAVALTGVGGVLAWSAHTTPPTIEAVVGFGLLFLLAEFVPVKYGHISYSVGFVVAVAAVLTVGPAAAGAAAMFASIDRELAHREDWVARILLNAGQFCLSTLALGAVFEFFGSPGATIEAADFPLILVPLVLGTCAFFVANAMLVSIMIGLVRTVPIRDIMQSDYRRAAVTHLSFTALGVVLSMLVQSIGWKAVPFVIIPLLAARHAFQTSESMRLTFERSMTGMITALEAKDRYTRGHAERVSQLSGMVARTYGFSESKARRVGYAALLHDIGKVTVSTKVLQKPGKLTPEEYDHMKVHSGRGAELVGEIDLLGDMVDGVRHHHERLDGRGYPDGLVGSELSDVAKIIMVCDAFDSMTSTRSYRRAVPMDKAFAELHRCEGTQFEPSVIEALKRAVAINGWEPAPEEYGGETVARPEISAHADVAAL